MILSGRCAPATVSHDAAAPPRTQRDCRLLMPAPSVYIIVTARMSALVGLGGRTSASAECADICPGGQSVGQAAQFCLVVPVDNSTVPSLQWARPPASGRKHGENALLVAKRKHLARTSKMWIGRSGSKSLLGILIARPREMPTPPERSYSARVASCFGTATWRIYLVRSSRPLLRRGKQTEHHATGIRVNGNIIGNGTLRGGGLRWSCLFCIGKVGRPNGLIRVRIRRRTGRSAAAASEGPKGRLPDRV